MDRHEVASGDEGGPLSGVAVADAFVERWSNVSASELAPAQSAVVEPCELLGIERPYATAAQGHMFERPVSFHHGDGHTNAGRSDCWRRDRFVLEMKKWRTGTRSFDEGLQRAHDQAEDYPCVLFAEEGKPPFVDAGEVVEPYSEFPRSAATYVPFPAPRRHRLALDDLRRGEVGERLHLVWASPLRPDSARTNAEDTRGTSGPLAQVDGLPHDLCSRFRVSRCDRSTSYFIGSPHQP